MSNPRKITSFVENVCEASAACLFTMVQGNILLIGISHLLVVAQTGITAGLLASITLLLANNSKPWVISLVPDSITAAVDYFVHPGVFASLATEALVTGIAAGMLSYLLSNLIASLRAGNKVTVKT